MKFGRNLTRNQVPEWSVEYINYKGLKKLIKSASDGKKQDEEIDLAGTVSCSLYKCIPANACQASTSASIET